jgi:hypothetical protein
MDFAAKKSSVLKSFPIPIPSSENFPPNQQLTLVMLWQLWMLFSLSAALLLAQNPADAELNQAYKALASKDYDTSIAAF